MANTNRWYTEAGSEAGDYGYVDDTDPYTARFNAPLGIEFSPDYDYLYICDAGNLALRRLNMSTREVDTLTTFTDPPCNLTVAPSSGNIYVTTHHNVGASNPTELLLVEPDGTTTSLRSDTTADPMGDLVVDEGETELTVMNPLYSGWGTSLWVWDIAGATWAELPDSCGGGTSPMTHKTAGFSSPLPIVYAHDWATLVCYHPYTGSENGVCLIGGPAGFEPYCTSGPPFDPTHLLYRYSGTTPTITQFTTYDGCRGPSEDEANGLYWVAFTQKNSPSGSIYEVCVDTVIGEVKSVPWPRHLGPVYQPVYGLAYNPLDGKYWASTALGSGSEPDSIDDTSGSLNGTGYNQLCTLDRGWRLEQVALR